jgi:hypothetical protein
VWGRQFILTTEKPMTTIKLTDNSKEILLNALLKEIAEEEQFQRFLGRIGLGLANSDRLESLTDLYTLLLSTGVEVSVSGARAYNPRGTP